MLAVILKNQLFFCVSGCSYFTNRKRSDTCNPVSSKHDCNTAAHTAHITTVVMDNVICLGRRKCRSSFAFNSYFSRLLSANSTQYKSFRVEFKDGELEIDISRQKSRIYFVF